jgi:prepilin-type N-terminal cleavage/methylation domain-containing protein
MRESRTSGFTLTEMLTVLAIVGILLAATMPAVTHLMKSSGLSVAARQVSNTLNLARQLAITKHVYARVVFPYDITGSQPDMWYRAYAVITNHHNTATAVPNWRYASKWEYLPVGVVFLDSTPVGMAVGLTPLPAPSGALDDGASLNVESGLRFPDDITVPPVGSSLAYVEFDPTGAARSVAGGDSVLTITLGIVDSGSLPRPTSKTPAGILANVGTLTVNSMVGRIQVTRP